MKGRGNVSFAALIALKLVCCGALLLVLSGVSLGALMSTVSGNGWVQFSAIAVALLAVGWWLLQRRRGRSCGTGRNDEIKPRGGSIPRADTAMRAE